MEKGGKPLPKKQPPSSSKWKTVPNSASDTARRLLLQKEYSNAIGRTRSAKGAINAKKKRTRMMEEMKALRDGDGFNWLSLASKKRRVSRPLSALKKTKESIEKLTFDREQDKTKVLKLLNSVEEGVKPLLVETQRFIENAKRNKERLDTLIQRGLDVDRAVLHACGDVFNLQPNFFYATPECQNQILPGSVFQISEWHRNNTRSARSSAPIVCADGTILSSHVDGGRVTGSSSVGAISGKVSSKSEVQGKRHATAARQDIPDSIVEHVPECL